MSRALIRQCPPTLASTKRLSTRSILRCIPTGQHARVPRQQVQISASLEAGPGMDPELKKSIDSLIERNNIVVFMKGSPQFPQCGFSNTVVQILNTLGAKYEAVDILADPRLRSGMKVYSQWPTFPQVYINGEFFGGCDIMIGAYQSGELKEILEVAQNS
ncbi:hypothetical protein Vretimale_5537 [Volvox reticuliferus]|uniref:Glutaredoxin domain-containing protein n=1 Tax=Volvox reticuliferus TaxID=1737510 RepID=A0A8J4FGW2_9CHLO|nr:hypothetical protein Vretifemale_5551 [Volvox reticuliferus]GIM00542.1 hypothetical protein Vretimale_5537 [Volvox reticuliferus]